MTATVIGNLSTIINNPMECFWLIILFSYSLLISKPRFAPIAEEIVSEELETRKRNDSSIRMGISINSTNSWLFSDAART